MEPRIERLASGCYGTQTEPAEDVVQLPPDQIHSCAELLRALIGGLKCGVEAIQHGQERGEGVCQGKIPKVLLLPGHALAGIFEVRLCPSRAVAKCITFRVYLFQLGWRG